MKALLWALGAMAAMGQGPALAQMAAEPVPGLFPYRDAERVERGAALLLTSHDPTLEPAFERVVRFSDLIVSAEASR